MPFSGEIVDSTPQRPPETGLFRNDGVLLEVGNRVGPYVCEFGRMTGQTGQGAAGGADRNLSLMRWGAAQPNGTPSVEPAWDGTRVLVAT